MHWMYWLALVVAVVWLVTSLVAGWILEGERQSDSESFWQWVLQHKAIAGSIAVVYLSTAGLVHETQFYEHLGLSAMRYVDPGSLAYAILGHWELALAAAVGALAALLVVMWAWRRIGTGPSWGGRLSEHVQNRSWPGMALWFLALPAKSVGVMRTILVVVVTSAFVVVPLGVAAGVADDAYWGIADDAPGTLRLSRPAKSVSGVRHVASSSTHMILVYQCGVGPTRDSTGWFAGLIGAFQRVGDAFEARLIGVSPGPAPPGPWRPIIVPWSSVASFDLDYGKSPANGERKTPGATEDDEPTDDCAPPWKSEPSYGGQGPVGPQGDSVAIQYSREGTADAEWVDKPTQGVRYIRFRVGGGEWQPPEGIRITGSSELWYGVMFKGFRLSQDVEKQLEVETVLPNVRPQSNSDVCRIEVAGCASETPFVRACAEGSSTDCAPCGGSVDCRLMVARLDEEDRIAGYYSADRLLSSRSELQCGDDVRECVKRVNGILNCGAANLRALATVAELGSLEFSTVLDEYGLSLPEVQPSGKVQIGGLLVDACTRVRDGDLRGIAAVKAAEPSPGLSQCWQPSKSTMNHAAIIRMVGDHVGTFGGCLDADGSRGEVH